MQMTFFPGEGTIRPKIFSSAVRHVATSIIASFLLAVVLPYPLSAFLFFPPPCVFLFLGGRPLILPAAKSDDKSGFTDKRISAAGEQRKYSFGTPPETNRLFVHVKILPRLSAANCEFPAAR